MRRPILLRYVGAVAAGALVLGAAGLGCARPSEALPNGTTPVTNTSAAAMSIDLPAVAAPDTIPGDEVLPLIARADAEAAALLRANPAAFTWERLPFYAQAGVLRATALLPRRPVEFRYVYARGAGGPAGHAILPLGSPERVIEANAASGFRLAPATALPYLEFYLASSGGAGYARRRLVRDAQSAPWLPATATDPTLRAARERASARVHPPRVEGAVGGGLRVTVTAVRGQALEAVTFGVERDGRVTEERATVLVPEAPVVQVL